MVDDILVEDGSKLELDVSELISSISRDNFLRFIHLCKDVRVLFKVLSLLYVVLHVVDDAVAICITVFRLLHATKVSFVGEAYRFKFVELAIPLSDHSFPASIIDQYFIENLLDASVVFLHFPRRIQEISFGELRGNNDEDTMFSA